MSLVSIKSLTLSVAFLTLMACTPKEPTTTAEHTKSEAEHVEHHQHTTSTHQPMNNSPAHVGEYVQSMGQMHHAMIMASEEQDPDIAFVKGMIPHHQGAIDMAKIQLKYGQVSEIRQLAEQILKAQQPEIDMMNQWLSSYQSTQADNNAPHIKAYQQIMGSHDVMMSGTQDPNADVAFVKGMIPHHQGAIDMAKIQLEYGKNEQMRKLAQDIIDAQQAEIDFMNQWLATHEGKK